MNLIGEAIEVYNQIADRFDMHILIMSAYRVRVPNVSDKQWRISLLRGNNVYVFL